MSSSEVPLAERTSEAEVRDCLRVLYMRMKADRMVGFFFDGQNIDAIVEGQVSLVMALLGAKVIYDGVPLPRAHRSLPLLPGHFDRRHALLREVLDERAVDDRVKAAWLEADAAWRKAILSAGEDARRRARDAQDSDETAAEDAPSSG